MPIPLFSGSAGSLPNIAPSNSTDDLSLDSYFKGAAAAKNIPTATSAVAQGVTEGIDKYQEVASNQQKIQENALILDERRRTHENEIAAKNAEAQAAADKAQREIQLRQKQDEFTAILQEGDPNKIKDAYVSGKFGEVLAANPKLDAYSLKVSAQAMSPEEASAFRNSKLQEQYQYNIDLYRGKIDEQNKQHVSDYMTSPLRDTIESAAVRESKPDSPVAPPEMLVRADTVAAGSTDWDPTTGVGTPAIGAPASSSLFDLYDTKTNRLIKRNVSKEDHDIFMAARAAQVFQNRHGIQKNGTPDPVGVINDAQRQKDEEAQKLQVQQTQQKAAEISGTSTDPDFVKNLSGEDLKKYLLTRDKFKKSVSPATPAPQQSLGPQAKVEAIPQVAAHPASEEVVARVNADPLLAGQPALFKGIVAVESGGKRNAKSPTGVKGLAQVTQTTAGQYGLNRNVPAENVQAGLLELQAIMSTKQFGASVPLGLMAYNGGRGLILDAVRKANSLDPDAVLEVLKETLPKKKYLEVASYPDKVIGHSLSFIDPSNPQDLVYVQRLRSEGLVT